LPEALPVGMIYERREIDCSDHSWAGKAWVSQVRRSELDEFKQRFTELKRNFGENNNFQMYLDIYHIRENLDVLIEYKQRTMGEFLESPITFGSLIAYGSTR
jgi:hypothetical protein